jgi:hypothetical protein
MNRPKLRALLLLLIFSAAYIALPAATAAAQNNNAAAKSSLAVPVSGTASASAISGPLSSLTGPITGTFNIQSFQVINGVVNAVGTLVVSVTNAAGMVTTTVFNNVAIPLAGTPTASCPILSLTLGPLHLDLLGLVIDLNQINLNITAQPGPGNLLGNLLCDVANLLNNPSGLANLLNQILGALRL